MQRASHQAGTPERCLTRRDVVKVGTPKSTAEQLALLKRFYLTGKPLTLDERIDYGLDIDELALAMELLRQQLPKLRGSFGKQFHDLVSEDLGLRAWYNGSNQDELFINRPLELLYTPAFNERWPSNIEAPRVVSGQFTLYLLIRPYSLLVIGTSSEGLPLVRQTQEIEDAVSTLRRWTRDYGDQEYEKQESLRAARITILTNVQEMLLRSERVRKEEAQPDGEAASRLSPFATN